MNIKKALTGLVTAAALVAGSSASATLMSYQITVAGSWLDTGGNPYGMPLSPTLSGSITVDNAFTHFAAVRRFSLTTGTKTWTLADFDPLSASLALVYFDGLGNLDEFFLVPFISNDRGRMSFYSNNGVLVEDSTRAFNLCTGCVSFTRTAAIPEPSSLLLASFGVFAFRKRNWF